MNHSSLNLKHLIATYLLFIWMMANSQERTEVAGIQINYEESKVPDYTLPDPLVLESGKPVKSTKTWTNKRRAEILSLFESEQFGKAPDRKNNRFSVFEKGTYAFDSTVIRKQITIYFTEDTSKYKADLLLYLPANTDGPVPILLKIGFTPNILGFDDTEIREGTIRTREGKLIPASEGRSFGKFDIDPFISNGIGVAAIYYGDIEPDFPLGIKYGIRGHYLEQEESQPAPDEWGAIAAWSWGLSCAMDYLQTDKDVKQDQVALYGVSRLGKTVLWTAAQDPRFGMVIPSCSGEGGAALSRRQFGETIKHMVDSTRFLYQFCGNRTKYVDDPNSSPVDAHMLISLVAPRPILLINGSTDRWSDPKGEFLAAKAATPVYELYDTKGIDVPQWPEADTPILNDIGYFMHEGGHGPATRDYEVIIDFINMHFQPNK